MPTVRCPLQLESRMPAVFHVLSLQLGHRCTACFGCLVGVRSPVRLCVSGLLENTARGTLSSPKLRRAARICDLTTNSNLPDSLNPTHPARRVQPTFGHVGVHWRHCLKTLLRGPSLSLPCQIPHNVGCSSGLRARVGIPFDPPRTGPSRLEPLEAQGAW